MKRIYYVCTVVLIFVVGSFSTCSYIDYHHKEVMNDSLNNRLQQLLGKDQGLMELIFRDLSGTVTYREIFDNCEKSVSSRNDILVELRGLYPNMESRFRDSLYEFLSLENELVRNISLMSRYEMKFTSSMKDYINTPSYWYYSDINNRLSNEIEECYSKEQEYSKESYHLYKRLDSMEVGILFLAKQQGFNMVSIYSKYYKLSEKWISLSKRDDDKSKSQIDTNSKSSAASKKSKKRNNNEYTTQIW